MDKESQQGSGQKTHVGLTLFVLLLLLGMGGGLWWKLSTPLASTIHKGDTLGLWIKLHLGLRSPNQPAYLKELPLEQALKSQHPKMVGMLLEAGAEPDVVVGRRCHYVLPKDATMLFCGVKVGQPRSVKLLLDALPQAKRLQKAGEARYTVLHLAAKWQRPKMVELLLQAGFSPNTKDKKGRTPILYALGLAFGKNKRLDVLRLLLKAGANASPRHRLPTATTTYGTSLTYASTAVLAIQLKRLDILKLLMKHGVNLKQIDKKTGFTLLHQATKVVSPKLISFLIDKGLSVHATDNNGRTPLLQLAIYGKGKPQQAKALSLLLKAGAKIEQAGRDKKTSLHLAIEDKNVALVKLLLKAGASVKARNLHQFDTVETAVRFGTIAILKQLLLYGGRLGPSKNATDKALRERLLPSVRILVGKQETLTKEQRIGKQTPLSKLVEILQPASDRISFVKDLLRMVRRYQQYGVNRLLHAACARDDLTMLRFLLNKGLNVNASNNASLMMTPLFSCTSFQAVMLLHKQGAHLNAKSYNGNTALHAAVEWSREQVVQALIVAGANINAQNHMGETPLHLAIKGKDTKLVRLLLEQKANPWIKTSKSTGHQTPLDLAKSLRSKVMISLLKKAMSRFPTAQPASKPTSRPK